MSNIPVCTPLMAGNELAYVTDAVKSGWVSSSGPYVERFEQAFADYLGRKYAVSVSSGTAALHLCCAAAGLQPGDEVIVPTFTMIASAYAVIYCGATPVFVDCDTETWTLQTSSLDEALSPRTKAIMAVPIYGHPCDFEEIRRFANRNKLLVIEDAAEGLGSECRSKLCGSESTLAGFSFFANKLITTGEGGMVVTDDPLLFEQMKMLRNMGFSNSGPRNYKHEIVGFNYRMTNLAAALGLAQLEQLDKLLELRRATALHYNSLFANHDLITTPVEKEWAKNSYWMYGILVRGFDSKKRDQLIADLADRGIETRPFFSPLHIQGVLKNISRVVDRISVAIDIAGRGLYLPSGPALRQEDRLRVAETVMASINELTI